MQQDVAAVLTAEHREMERLYEELQVVVDAERKRQLARDITRRIATHAVAEEQVLYPVMERALPDGEQQAAEAREEHKDIETKLATLDRLDPMATEFDETLRSMMLDLIPHAREEEEDLFPALRAVVGDEEMVALGAKIQAAEKLAPTRPHPAVPNTGVVRTLAGPGAAVVDRTRDALEERKASPAPLILLGAGAVAVAILVRRRRARAA